MIVFPALDIFNGEVVRLIEGDFSQKTVYAKDPMTWIENFNEANFEFMHLVDLSGAKNPDERQLEVFKKIIRASKMKIQTGGGVRSLKDIENLLDLGADRVVLGSLAVINPELMQIALKEFGPSRITLALDVKIENEMAMVMIQGWQNASAFTLEAVVAKFLDHGLTRILCTDISRDGRMTGPNIELYQNLVLEFPNLEIQASGGVSSPKDLSELSKIKAHSVVIGKALLSGAVKIDEVRLYA